MIAEFANYRSWIAWVPLVGLLAIPLLFRRVLPLCLALLGAFVGFVVTSLAPPLGRNAEQLGPNIAVGLVDGAIIGGLVGGLIQSIRPRIRPRDASVPVVVLALGLGVLGAIVGGFSPSLLDRRPPDLNVEVLRMIAMGGGLGWSLGALMGLRLARSAFPPGTAQRVLLAIAAAVIAVVGAGIVASIQARSFGPSIDYLTRRERQQLPFIAALYCIDTTIAVLTLVAVAVRGTGVAGPSALPAGIAVPPA